MKYIRIFFLHRYFHVIVLIRTTALYWQKQSLNFFFLKFYCIFFTGETLFFKWKVVLGSRVIAVRLRIFSSYWVRLSRIWRILRIKEGVIYRGWTPRWNTPSEICRILHMLRKPNSIIALLFIQNISPFLKEFRHFALFFRSPNITRPCPQVFSFSGLIICSGLHFWRHWLIDYLVNSSWLWWIMRVILTNQKRGNILNE